MIIRCPKCKTKFIVKAQSKEALLAKKVKCCSCETVWNIDETSFFQEPLKQIKIDIEHDLHLPIPPSVSFEELAKRVDALTEDEQIEAPSEQKETEAQTEIKTPFFKKYKKILIISGFIFLYIVIAFFISHNLFFKNSDNASIDNNEEFYVVLNKTDILKDELGENKIIVSGQVINKTDDIYSIPKISVLFLSNNDDLIQTKTGKTQTRIIPANSSIDFSFTFPYENYNIKNVKVEFENKEHSI